MLRERLFSPRRVGTLGTLALGAAVAFSGCGGNANPDGVYPTGTRLPTASPTETFTPTPRPTIEIIPTPSPTEAPTPTPRPTADPNNKCDPRLVPDARVNVEPTQELPKDFVLHVPILEYHLVDHLSGGIAQISLAPAMSSLVVTPENFRAQMQLLHDNGWTTITMAQLAKDWVNRITPTDKTFVPTFDDGYEDGWLVAQILKEIDPEYVGTFYPISAYTDSSTHLSSWQIFVMTEMGMDFGNHSLNHSENTNRQTAGNEVFQAEAQLANWSGVWPSTIAYPFGSEGTYENAVTQCPLLIFAAIQQPHDKTNDRIPQAIEDNSHRLAEPRVKVWSWIPPGYLLCELNHLNQEITNKC